MAFSSLTDKLRTWYTPGTMHSQNQSPGPAAKLHLYGLRGILAVCGILTVFVQTFIPALVWKDMHDSGYQNILRIIFSSIIWDEGLIGSFFIALSCYSIALRFLSAPTPSSFSGSIIRRVIRMTFVTAISCGIVYSTFGGIGTGYIERFTEVLPNQHITAPQVPENGLVALNAIFDIFWAVRDFYSQAANIFWPTQTLWNVSLIFSQSWTVYFLMVILPFTRPGWHAGAIFTFALGSFWTCSWGWYSAAALFLADYDTSSSLCLRLDEDLTVNTRLDWKVPYKYVGGMMAAIGFAMKSTWAVLPQYHDKELLLHPFLLLSERTNVTQFAAADPYPRLDNFLVIFGVLLLSQTSVLVRRSLSCKLLVILGKRSMSGSSSSAVIANS
jgi:hypothetical protein